MVEDVVCDGTCRFSPNITENVIKLQVGCSQAVQGTVFLASEHIGELEVVEHQVTELSYFRGRDKAWLYHVTQEQVTDPFSILVVSLVPLLWFRVFGVCKGNKAGFLQDVEDGDSVLGGRFHADFCTVIFGKSSRQFP